MTLLESLEIPKTIVFVGLMGAGKSCMGRNLAKALGLTFVDADAEIEKAAGCTIEDIFELHGETAFRDGERRVLARLLDGPVCVLGTGGGAFMDLDTRARIRQKAISIWLRADLNLLVSRVGRRTNRPLLRGKNAREVLGKLIDERYPVYAEAHITVDSDRESPESTVDRVLGKIEYSLGGGDAESAA